MVKPGSFLVTGEFIRRKEAKVTAIGTISWTGNTGRSYKYWIYPLGAALQAKPGNYAFAKRLANGNWIPLYFGETQDLGCRFDNHHKIDLAKKNGATHLHAHLTDGTLQTRLDEETDLVRKWNPTCNG